MNAELRVGEMIGRKGRRPVRSRAARSTRPDRQPGPGRLTRRPVLIVSSDPATQDTLVRC